VITVTGLGGGLLIVNVDLIVTVEETPDTVITLINGDKLIVRESLDEIVDRTVDFRRRGAPPSVPLPTRWTKGDGEDDHAD
jgi:flagellar protein FlbD